MTTPSGILNVNKPAGMTSHDVVAIVRRLAGTKKVGHGGTLDPMAEGVLPVFVGSATRIIEYMSEAGDPEAKIYRCTMQLGITTDTLDTTGGIISSLPEDYNYPTPEEIKETLLAFVGKQKQIPPIYSAIKINGRKLYELARKGQEIPEEKIKPREIEISYITDIQSDEKTHMVSFTVACTGGTYIRSICRDAGEKLGCGAAMSALTRLKSGPFKIEDSVTIEELKEVAESGAPLPYKNAESAIPNMQRIELTKEQAEDFTNGRSVVIPAHAFVIPGSDPESLTTAVFTGETFIGIATITNKTLKPKKVIK